MLGVKQFRIDPATPVEDLRPLDGTEITSGDSVNIGGSQTRAGFVLTGVVVVVVTGNELASRARGPLAVVLLLAIAAGGASLGIKLAEARRAPGTVELVFIDPRTVDGRA